jgi:hypothetical protein
MRGVDVDGELSAVETASLIAALEGRRGHVLGMTEGRGWVTANGFGLPRERCHGSAFTRVTACTLALSPYILTC